MMAIIAARKIEGKRQKSRPEAVSVNCLLSWEMRERAEVKNMISMIDRELGNAKSVPEMDFRAGYLAGRIEEKKTAGMIAEGDAERLRNMLYIKYEVLRRLET